MADLRKHAANTLGRSVLQERFGAAKLCAVDVEMLQKLANTDQDLLKVAATLDSNQTLNAHETLGGGYSSQVRE